MAAKTKDIIVDAFLDLVDETGTDKITITQLVEKCDISRQTFYYHFDDVATMITWAFKDGVNDILKSCRNSINWIDAAMAFTPFIEKYKNYISKASKSSRSLFVNNLIYECVYDFAQKFSEQIENVDDYTRKELDFVLRYNSHAFAGILLEFIEEEQCNYHALYTLMDNAVVSKFVK